MSIPKRRWFRFRLRTLFVVMTVVAVWCGYQVNWIRLRQQFIAEQDAKFCDHFVAEDGGPHVQSHLYSNPPSTLALFRENGYSFVEVLVEGQNAEELSDQDYATMRRAERLFPEAEIYFTAVWRDGFWQGGLKDLRARRTAATIPATH